MAYYLYKVIAGNPLNDKLDFIESEGSAADMASMIDIVKDMHGGDKIQFLYVEERIEGPSDDLLAIV